MESEKAALVKDTNGAGDRSAYGGASVNEVALTLQEDEEVIPTSTYTHATCVVRCTKFY